MHDIHNIAPRVSVYSVGSVPPPTLAEGWLPVPPPTLAEGWLPVPPPTLAEGWLPVPPPTLGEGWLALAQFAPRPGRPAVFGDGSHATTRLCAAAVDLLCRQLQPQAVLDVGTGTGVLARIARARGVPTVVGTDIDPDALSSARANSDLDMYPVEIQFSAAPPDQLGVHFDLVVANILEAPLCFLAPALCRALQPRGLLLLSGFTRPQAPALRVLYQSLGLRLVRESNLDEWVLLTFSAG